MCECGETSGGKEPWTVNIYEEWPTAGYIEPICMGALISHHHILTSKLCFGEMHGETFSFLPTPLKLLIDRIKVMVGSIETFPTGFPHSSSRDIDFDSLKRQGIVLNDVKEIKYNQNDEFCILTMHHYVEFTDSIRSLCLPEDPKNFYRRRYPNNVDILGYGYKDLEVEDIYTAAIWETNNDGKERKLSRRRKHVTEAVISRKDCSDMHHASNLKTYDDIDMNDDSYTI